MVESEVSMQYGGGRGHLNSPVATGGGGAFVGLAPKQYFISPQLKFETL